MNKSQALEILNAKLERTDGEEWVVELVEKFAKLPEEAYKDSSSFYDLRLVIESYKKPSQRKSSANKQTTYVALAVPIDAAREKAIGFVTGTNSQHGSNYREHMQWVPISQIIEADGKTYIPVWLVAKNLIWNVVNVNDKIIK